MRLLIVVSSRLIVIALLLVVVVVIVVLHLGGGLWRLVWIYRVASWGNGSNWCNRRGLLLLRLIANVQWDVVHSTVGVVVRLLVAPLRDVIWIV